MPLSVSSLSPSMVVAFFSGFDTDPGVLDMEFLRVAHINNMRLSSENDVF